MEKKESQGGLGRWRLGAVTFHLRGHQGSLAWGLSVWVGGYRVEDPKTVSKH